VKGSEHIWGIRATKAQRLWQASRAVSPKSPARAAMDSQEDSIDIAKLKRFALGLAVSTDSAAQWSTLSR